MFELNSVYGDLRVCEQEKKSDGIGLSVYLDALNMSIVCGSISILVTR